jgi:hypothetical protein
MIKMYDVQSQIARLLYARGAGAEQRDAVGAAADGDRPGAWRNLADRGG